MRCQNIPFSLLEGGCRGRRSAAGDGGSSNPKDGGAEPQAGPGLCHEPTRDGPRCVELTMRWQNGHLQVRQVPAHLGAREALSFPFSSRI